MLYIIAKIPHTAETIFKPVVAIWVSWETRFLKQPSSSSLGTDTNTHSLHTDPVNHTAEGMGSPNTAQHTQTDHLKTL